nr:uncharacterized protein LOC123767808 [Procambarus clarkii]
MMSKAVVLWIVVILVLLNEVIGSVTACKSVIKEAGICPKIDCPKRDVKFCFVNVTLKFDEAQLESIVKCDAYKHQNLNLQEHLTSILHELHQLFLLGFFIIILLCMLINLMYIITILPLMLVLLHAFTR